MKVSVIIPVFNAEDYLVECLDSVINQTLKDIEIICVDDGSTDKSLEILKAYASKDKRFRILRQTNMHAGVARNNGLKIARGKYVIFLDADDIFASKMLEIMYHRAEENDLDMAICNVALLDNRTKYIMDSGWRMENAPNGVFSHSDVSENILQMFCLAAWNKLFKREFVLCNHIEFQALKRCNDNYFVIISMALATRIEFINEKFVLYRINNSQSLQGDRSVDSHAADGYCAFTTVKKKLLELELYGEFKHSLLNFYLDDFLGTLLKQTNYENFEQVYRKLKPSIVKDLEIEEHEESFWLHYGNVDICRDIYRLDITRFLYKYFRIYRNQLFAKHETYQFPAYALKECRKIVIYGAGSCGKYFFRQIINNSRWKIVAWLDKNYRNIDMGCILVRPPKDVLQLDFDKILVAIADKEIKQEVKEFLILSGIEESKIVIWGDAPLF